MLVTEQLLLEWVSSLILTGPPAKLRFIHALWLRRTILVPLKDDPWTSVRVRNEIEEVRHKIKVSNHSATRLVRFWQKPNHGHYLLSVAMETMLSCQTGTWKTYWVGDYFCYDMLASHPATTRNYRHCQPPPLPVSTGNIGKFFLLQLIVLNLYNYVPILFKVLKRCLIADAGNQVSVFLVCMNIWV